MHWLGDAQGGQNWVLGFHQFRLNVVTARGGVNWIQTDLCEAIDPFPSGGFNTVQLFNHADQACDTTGVKNPPLTAQISDFTVAGDLSRPYWVLLFNGPPHGQSSFEIDSDQNLDTPWTIPPPEQSRTVLQAVARMGHY